MEYILLRNFSYWISSRMLHWLDLVLAYILMQSKIIQNILRQVIQILQQTDTSNQYRVHQHTEFQVACFYK